MTRLRLAGIELRDAVETVNIPPLFALLITERLCTLHELKTVYTMSDALDMYEAWAVAKENELRLMEQRRIEEKL